MEKCPYCHKDLAGPKVAIMRHQVRCRKTNPPPHQTYGTPEHALLSLLLAIAASEEKYGQLLPEVLNQRSHKDTKEPAYEYALRVGMEIGGSDE